MKDILTGAFLGAIFLPSLVGLILFLIFSPQFYSGAISIINSGGGEPEIMQYIFSTYMQFAVVYFIVGFVLTAFVFIVTWWYLGRKARSKWLLLLLFVPFGFIILLILENKEVGYGGDFADESATS